MVNYYVGATEGVVETIMAAGVLFRPVVIPAVVLTVTLNGLVPIVRITHLPPSVPPGSNLVRWRPP